MFFKKWVEKVLESVLAISMLYVMFTIESDFTFGYIISVVVAFVLAFTSLNLLLKYSKSWKEDNNL